MYFAQTHTGSIKIGSTDDLTLRLKTLGLYYGRPLRLITVVVGGEREEREFHRRFRRYRLGGPGAHTEQFQPGPELVRFLRHLVSADPDYRGVALAMPIEAKYLLTDRELNVSGLPCDPFVFVGIPTCPGTRNHAVVATIDEVLRGVRKKAVCGVTVSLRPVRWLDGPESSVYWCSPCRWKTTGPYAAQYIGENLQKFFGADC